MSMGVRLLLAEPVPTQHRKRSRPSRGRRAAPASRHARLSIASLVLITALRGLVGCTGATPQEHLQRAAEHQEAGRLQAAVIELKNALQQAPDMAEARLKLGLIHLRRNEIQAAIKELERAERLGVPDERLAVPLARARIATGDAQQTQKVVKRFSAQSSETLTSEEAAVLGRAHAALGSMTRAREVLGTALERTPEAEPVLLALARLEWQAGNEEAALDHARAAIEAKGASQQSWELLGNLRLASGNGAGAVTALRKALSVAEVKSASLRVDLARAFIATGDLENARSVVDEALANAPKYPGAHYLDAVLRMESGELDAAATAIEHVLSVAPNHIPSRYLRAVIAHRQGRLAQAQHDLERVIKHAPKQRRARLLLAAIHTENGMPARAAEVLQPGVETGGGPPSAGYLAAYGQSLLRVGEARRALEILRQAAAAAPNAAKIRTQLALAQIATGSPGAAEAELEQSTDLTSDFPISDALLVLLQLRAERYDDALASAERQVEREPNEGLAHNMLGLVRLAREEMTAARDAFERALEVEPRFSPAALNLAALHRRDGDVEGARAQLQSVLEYEPANRQALDGLVRLAETPSELEAVRERVERARAVKPASRGLTVLYAQLQRATDNPQGALETLATLGDNQRLPDAALSAKSKAALAQGHAEQAIAALATLHQRHPDSPGVAVSLASALRGDGQLARASSVLEGVASRLNAPPVKLSAAQIALLIDRDQLERARERLDSLAKRDGSEGLVALLRAEAALARDDKQTAVKHFERSLALRPSSRVVHRLYAVQRSRAHHEAAKATLKSWLDAHPDDLSVRRLLAEHLLTMGNRGAAIAEYERLNQQRPDDAGVLNNLAWLYGETGRAGSVDLARRAREIAPNTPAVLDTLGWLLVRQGDIDQALEPLRRAAEGSPDNPDIHYHLAVAQQRAGNLQAARQSLTHALSLEEGFASASEARSLLRSLARQ